MRRRALVPILLLALAACGDDGDSGDDGNAAENRPCFGETTVPVAPETSGAPSTAPGGTGAPTGSGAPAGTATPPTSPAGTQAPTGTVPATSGEGAEPAGIARPRTAAPDDEGSDDSVVDVELEPVTGETTPPTTIAPKPEVSLPEEPPTDGIQVTDIENGEGPKARNGDYVAVRYVGVSIETGEEFDTNYDQDAPLEVTVGNGQVIQGFDQGLVGMREGGVRQIDIPAALAYGEQEPAGGQGDGGTPATTQAPTPEGPVLPATSAPSGADDAGTETTVAPDTTESAGAGLARPASGGEPTPTTTGGTAAEGTSPTGSTPDGGGGQGSGDEGPPRGPLSFVVEVENLVRRPSIQNIVEPSWCTPELVVDERQEGSGDAAVEAGDTIRAHVVTLRGDNLYQIESTWNQGQPSTIELVANLEEGGVAEGIIQGLEGMKPGGRRIITMPPDLAYGEEGLPQIGLPADKDFIVVVDLIEIVD